MLPELLDDRDKPSPEWTRPAEPPIHRAARRGELHVLERLLQGGHDINTIADLEYDNGGHLKGLTTLMVAARSIDGATTDTLRWLVEHGADIHARSRGGNSAAWYAAGHGGRWHFHARAVTPDHTDRLVYLLSLGLDPHECSSNGRSLLVEACSAGDPSRIGVLLARGVSVSPESAEPNPAGAAFLAAIDRAIASGNMPHHAGASSFQIPLFCAAASGSAECVELILRAGADPHTLDDSGRTALFVAGSPGVVRLLVGAGTDPDATDEYGHSALDEILSEWCESEVCGPARFEIADALLGAGADIELRSSYGRTRLADAAFRQNADAVDYLLARGADAHAVDRTGAIALHGICWQGKYSNEETDLDCARIVRTLAAAGTPLEARNHSGQTAMHEAAGGDWGNPTAIRTLLELGADPEPTDERGQTPLMDTVRLHEIECARLLLDAGADPTRPDAEGKTAITLAEASVRYWEQTVASGPDLEDAKRTQKENAQAAAWVGWGGDEEASRPTDLSGVLELQTRRRLEWLDEAQAMLALLRADAGRAGDHRPTA